VIGWVTTPGSSAASSPPPGRTVPVQHSLGAAYPVPGQWPRLSMALLGAFLCCLLAAWHASPGLGLPLAPAVGGCPARAAGEWCSRPDLDRGAGKPGGPRQRLRLGGAARCQRSHQLAFVYLCAQLLCSWEKKQKASGPEDRQLGVACRALLVSPNLPVAGGGVGDPSV
jgi:hypothetical protein